MSRISSSVNGSSRSNGVAHQRRHSLTNSVVADDHLAMLDLFSRNRRTDASSDVKLRRLSLGSSVKQNSKSGFDDLLSSVDAGGKNDYDWLLTPPGTPLFPSSDGSESQPAAFAPRKSTRSVSTIKASRLSVSESENIHPSRPARSSSVTRPAVSSSQYSSFSNKSTSILNTSSASVSSYIRPSTPTARSSSNSRPSTPTSRSTPSRSSTPSRVRPSPPSSSVDRSRPSTNSRPSTPTSRPQIPANLNSPITRTVSRPSTPTRRNSAPSLSQSTGPSTPVRTPSNGSRAAPVSRPSSPSPRVRPPPQPIVLHDFPLDTPPNLRTTLPDRPLSAGRSRPGSTHTVKGNVETQSPATLRRQPSPNVTRGRLSEPNGRGRMHANGQVVDAVESHRPSHVLEASRKLGKASPDTTGFGRTISKKSLDMAIKHMDIRNGTNGTRPVMGSTLFPQSIRSANSRSQPGWSTSVPAAVDRNVPVNNNAFSENGKYLNRYPENVNSENKYPVSSRVSGMDIYESSRYDAILLKEDPKDTNWLHNGDDKFDQGPIFDNGFEHLPEPFGPM
ncbi:cell wall protein RBR3 [Heracleum sosnowskyi]|uniref:Cell wall protein RBR3 n=1 Tax=Heracleum sosnowskyi TaxID=360622 RepID=A0AAD8GWZ1_9APIA|nr:cell wall protein RBR3 [Heracleum sosnowskyi]